MNEYSFESASSDEDRDLPIVTYQDDETEVENAIAIADTQQRKRFTWEPSFWEDLDEVLNFLSAEGFTQYDKKDLDSGVKLYFRCRNVPKRSKVWCAKRYVVHFPAESSEIVLLNNLQEHDHEEITSKNRTQLSSEMIDFMNNLYANKTTSYESVIRHINHARST